MVDRVARVGGSFDRDSRNPVAPPGMDADNLARSESGNAGANLSRASSAEVQFGNIMDAVPFWGLYTVATSGRLTVMCNDGTGLGGSPYYGARGKKAIPPNTPVAYVNFPGSTIGTIIATLPPVTAGGRFTPMPGYVFMGSGPVGMASPMYDHISNNKEQAGGMDFNAAAPVDQLSGDQACLSPVDVGWVVSMSMAMLRAQDDCAVELYHFDSLMRLNAHNFELFSAAAETREFDDEGEPHIVRHVAKFPYEALGTTTPVEPFRQGEDSEDVFESAKEPIEPGQTGAWRVMEAGGYLGDMLRRQVQRPSDAFKSDPAKFGGFDPADGTAPAALSDIYEGVDGTLAFSSAKQILLRKTPGIPALVQNRLPDDAKDGDNPTNYKAAGQFGDGDDPTPSEEFDWGTDWGGSRVEFLGDYLTHFFMWYSLLAFRDHKNDWVVGDVPSKSQGWEEVQVGINKEAIESLRGSFWADMPKMVTVNIDAIKGDVKYYAGTSTVALLDDGSVVLEDAWGSSIVMGYGNIFIRPIGNLFMQPGQRAVTWCGLDYIVRSRGCMDFTATHGDLRATVGNNIQVLAGNDSDNNGGLGGILFESRAAEKVKDFNPIGEKVKDSGITFLAKKSVVSAFGDDVYLGTTGGTTGRSPGIVIDASRGGRGIYETGGFVVRESDKDFLDVFNNGDNISYKSSDISYTQSKLTLVEGQLGVVKGEGKGGDLIVDGVIACDNTIMAQKDIVSAYGIVAGTALYGKDGVAKYSPAKIPSMVGGTDRDLLEDVRSQYEVMAETDFEGQIKKTKTSQTEVGEKIEEAVRKEPHPGAKKILDTIGVSLRSTEDYEAGTFVVAETRWQVQLADSLTPWEEVPVVSNGGTGLETFPFPGMTFYIGEHALLTGGNKLVDPETGNPVPPGDAYKNAGGQSMTQGKLNDYKVFKSKYDYST